MNEEEMMVGVEEVVTQRKRRVAAVFKDPESGEVITAKAARARRYDKRYKLADGPNAGSGVLPLSGKDLDKFRGPKEFMEAARRYLEPEQVGRAFADALMESLQKRHVAMAKLLLPYVLGVPDKMEDSAGDALEQVMAGLLAVPATGRKRKQKSEKVIEVNGEKTDE